jgi:dUTP diphosphatase
VGHVMVLLYNLGDVEFKIDIGDRIAQFIVEKIETPEVRVVLELAPTDRGEGGFGSTGTNDRIITKS